MRDYQAVVRVRHNGFDLAANSEQLDSITGDLLPYGATAQLWPDVTEWTLTVGVPTLWDVAPVAGRTVRDAYASAGVTATVVRVDAWQVEEWDNARKSSAEE